MGFKQRGPRPRHGPPVQATDIHLSHILTHLGEERANYFHAVAPPVVQTSNFAFHDLDAFKTSFTDELGNHLYTRGNNPTVAILRRKVAALENAEDALIFGSGIAAIAAAVMGNLKAGDHIVCVRSPYRWTYILLDVYLRRFGITHTFVDGRDVANIEAALREETTLLMLESPNSALFELQDLEACARLAAAHDLVTVVDNSYASPLFQRPLDMGIDIVVHTCTKYLNGHSDVLGGALCASREMVARIFESEFMNLGAIPSPHDAWLVLRGMRTLDLRTRRSDESARTIATALEAHPKIERVLHPLLESHPQYDLARRQMSGTGGLFSIQVAAPDIPAMERFVARLERFLMAVSWGGYESLALPFCIFHNVPGRADSPLPWNLLRLYIGLEDPAWLLEDLERGLEVL